MYDTSSYIKEKDLKLNRPFDILFLEETSSTNDVCKDISKKSKKDTLVIAKHQTNGKGRLGRSFYSPDSSGIYMSLLLHSDTDPSHIMFLTTAAAVAVADAINDVTGKSVQIKWVNDIYLDDKKVCGILSESAFSKIDNKPEYLIVGIGINLYEPKDGFPEDIKDIAGSLLEESELDSTSLALLISKICNNLIYNFFEDTNRAFMNKYKKLSYLTGKKVYFEKNGVNTTGVVLGINDNAALVIKMSDGKQITLNAGEVSVKKINN